jgi:shikimate kinase
VRTNVVLIGMPAAGKSTVGVLLAKRLSKGFVDTDVLIQTREMRSLQDIVDKDGHLALRRIEEEVLLSMQVENHVIATGGSAAYSEMAMRRLAAGGVVVFLDVGLDVLSARLGDFGRRGLAKRPEQTLAELYNERRPLYERYADVRIARGDLGHDDLCRVIAERLLSAPAVGIMTGPQVGVAHKGDCGFRRQGGADRRGTTLEDQ